MRNQEEINKKYQRLLTEEKINMVSRKDLISPLP